MKHQNIKILCYITPFALAACVACGNQSTGGAAPTNNPVVPTQNGNSTNPSMGNTNNTFDPNGNPTNPNNGVGNPNGTLSANVPGTAPVDPNGQLILNGTFAAATPGWTLDGNVLFIPNAAEPNTNAARLVYEGNTIALSQTVVLPQSNDRYVYFRYNEAFSANPNLNVTASILDKTGKVASQANGADSNGGKTSALTMPVATGDSFKIEYRLGTDPNVKATAANNQPSPTGATADIANVSLVFIADPNHLPTDPNSPVQNPNGPAQNPNLP